MKKGIKKTECRCYPDFENCPCGICCPSVGWSCNSECNCCKPEPKCKSLMTFKKPITEKALQKMIKKAMGDFKMPYVIKNLEPLQSSSWETWQEKLWREQWFKKLSITTRAHIEIYITELLSAQQQKWKEELRKKIFKMKVKKKWRPETEPYFEALDEVLAILK